MLLQLKARRKKYVLLMVRQKDSGSSCWHYSILMPASYGSVTRNVQNRLDLVHLIVTKGHIVAKQGFTINKK